MKVLIVRAHPNTESFGQAIAATYIEGARASAARHEIREVNLATEDFDPVLRYGYQKHMEPDAFIERSKEDLLWAEHIVFITPIWWATFPSVLHGWFERVLTPEFAYRMKGLLPEGLLRGKTATLIATCAAPAFYNRLILNSPARLLKQSILGVCGIKMKRSYILGSMDGEKDTAARRANFLQKISEIASGK
ncbi:flavodoxin family protein [Leucobacter sp. OH2974_COT-288]|nr:flavodoxin family protein [Leucobacter sp. OH2974_COT-288]